MNAYRMGRSIILPHVRYINGDGCNSMMFHSNIINSHGHCHTLGCNRMDFSGLCSGHKMSKKEFLKRYCGGVETETRTNKE
jgi:hypothetical protein